MKFPIALLLSLLLAGSPSTRAQPIERWLLPEADEMVKASNTLCADQAKSALLSSNLRAAGRTKEEVLALLPDSPKALGLRVVSAMRENVEDAFSYPDLSDYTLYFFRSEVCFRETLSAVRMPRLVTMLEPVRGCQRSHGVAKSSALSRCLQGVVRAVEP